MSDHGPTLFPSIATASPISVQRLQTVQGSTIYVYKHLKPQDSFGEFNKCFLDLQKVQEVIRKHHIQIFLQLFWMTYCKVPNYHYVHSGSRTTPHEDNSPPDENKAHLLPTRTTMPRTIPHQDNSPLGPLPRNKTTHQDQNLYGGELSSWGVVRIRYIAYGKVFGGTQKKFMFWLFPKNGSLSERTRLLGINSSYNSIRFCITKTKC